ncbi:MAG: hypothetical protein ACE14S_01885 [Candidatus Bathyarchaeia archaeon]
MEVEVTGVAVAWKIRSDYDDASSSGEAGEVRGYLAKTRRDSSSATSLSKNSPAMSETMTSLALNRATAPSSYPIMSLLS